mmetsp:Transcript_4638/g.12950  ORF Transcript_4638/g.12950 Transcript_4638/m.12950 type:complete len:197 (-) Transcript_4638:2514-3104(-)
MKPAQQQQQQQQNKQQQGSDSTTTTGTNNPIQEMMTNDPELAEAMEIFAYMSNAERTEAMQELKELIGADATNDPEAMKLFEQLFNEVGKMKEVNGDGTSSSLQELVAEDERVARVEDVMHALRQAGPAEFETKVLARKEAILEAIVEAGQMTDEQAQIYRNDGAAWQDMLTAIWKDLQGQVRPDDQEVGAAGEPQ